MAIKLLRLLAGILLLPLCVAVTWALVDQLCALPPTGSLDRLLMSQASRLLYPLATIVAANAFSPTEAAFICRPTGGRCPAYAFTATVASDAAFPPLPDFGADAAATAASALRLLWSRLPLLRSVAAHVLAVTALSLAQALRAVQVTVSSSASGADSFVVAVPDDVVVARYLGIVLDRLQTEMGGEGAGRGAAATADVEAPPHEHPLVGAVRSRLANASVLRPDGVVLLGSLDVEAFDVTLC
jgi:hypothetical protein